VNPEKAEYLLSGPFSIRLAGRDATAWRWFLNGNEVMVEISNTAMEINNEHLSERVAEAKRSQGRSEIERMLDWDVPNPHVELDTDSE
jgi:hypothetical protein